ALPEPRLIPILGERRPVAGAAFGKQPWWPHLIGTRLHQCVDDTHGIENEGQIKFRFLMAEVKIDGSGEFDQLCCIWVCEHGTPLSWRLRCQSERKVSGLVQAVTTTVADADGGNRAGSRAPRCDPVLR